ncbi:MAG TPA: sigma-70 family RNA polymerase sigma factor [Bacteroidota bacterium]|nr:sigma-70 family RNA polymerase sigma factor [Bacteroidota bacterium]
MKQPADDFQLIRSFQAGDETAFEELVRRYQRQVANIIYLTLGDRSQIEDLTQETFIRVYRSLDKFAFDSSFYSWLYRIAVNLCIDEMRRRKIKRTLSLDFFSESRLEREETSVTQRSGADEVLDKEKRATILAALDKLSPEYKAVIVLREYNDLSYAEIAKILKISPQAVKSRIFRARSELRKLLQDYFQERL